VTTLAYVLLAILEFFLINWMGRLSISSGYYHISFIQGAEDAPLFNVMFRVLAPTVFLVLVATFLYANGFEGRLDTIWLVTVYYFAFRWAFNLVMERNALLNWPKQIVSAAVGIGLSYVAAGHVLTNREMLLPSGRGLSDQLWIVIIGFLYVTASRITWPQIGASARERKEQYLRHRFDLAQKHFGRVIAAASGSRAVEALSYSVLIYESFNRPRIYQALEKTLLFPTGVANTLGPMQVPTQVRLDDVELVRLGVDKLNAAFDSSLADFLASSDDGPLLLERAKKAPELSTLPATFASLQTYYQDEVVRRSAAQYNARSDYPREVAGIFAFLRSDHFRELDPEVRAERRKALAVAAAG
jgi:hypothetical protein